MNRFLQYSLSLLIASTALVSLNAMKHEQEKSIAELLCCLHSKDIPTDIDPLLARPILIINAQDFEQSLDRTSPEALCKSLLKYCNNLPNLNERFMPNAELGTLLATYCEKKNISLETFVDSDKQTILHHLAIPNSNLFDSLTTIRALVTVLTAVGNKVQQLTMVQDLFGGTALTAASYQDHNAIVQTLLTSVGNKAQELAMVQMLNGYTALHTAAFRGNLDIVQTLLTASGINARELAKVQTHEKETALDIAQQNKWPEIVALLQPYMKQNNQ